MDYFDKQDSNKAQEGYNHNQQDPCLISKTAFPDNWKVPQDGDFDFVSALMMFLFVHKVESNESLCVSVCEAEKPRL